MVASRQLHQVVEVWVCDPPTVTLANLSGSNIVETATKATGAPHKPPEAG